MHARTFLLEPYVSRSSGLVPDAKVGAAYGKFPALLLPGQEVPHVVAGAQLHRDTAQIQHTHTRSSAALQIDAIQSLPSPWNCILHFLRQRIMPTHGFFVCQTPITLSTTAAQLSVCNQL